MAHLLPRPNEVSAVPLSSAEHVENMSDFLGSDVGETMETIRTRDAIAIRLEPITIRFLLQLWVTMPQSPG